MEGSATEFLNVIVLRSEPQNLFSLKKHGNLSNSQTKHPSDYNCTDEIVIKSINFKTVRFIPKNFYWSECFVCAIWSI